MTTRRAIWGLIVGSAFLRLFWAASLGPGNDEAYHFLFSVHRDWSYFDHPPMIAVIETLGPALTGGRGSILTLRLGFIALFAGSTWLMARLTERYYSPRAGFLAAFALNVSVYYSIAVSTWVLPDGPLLFFWLLTLDRLSVALRSPGRIRPWVGVGLAWGGALLSKYHAVFLPAGTLLYLLREPSARAWLRRPGPYVAAVLGLLVFSPVLWWNATNGWASFAFQGGRALGELRFQPRDLVVYLVGQVVYLCPWIWFRLVSTLTRRVRAEIPVPGDRFLVCQAVVPLAVFTGVACIRPVLPHWTLVGFLALFPMLGRLWEEGWGTAPRRFVLVALVPVLIAALALVEARTGIFQQGRSGVLGLVKVSRDPTVDLIGWDQIAEELGRRGLLDQPRTFLFTGYWYESGQLAFATRRSSTPVLCYSARDSRSFAFWSRPEDWVGYDGILISVNNHANEPEGYRRWFTRIEPLGSFEVACAGAPIRKVRLFRCVGQTLAFPFDGPRPRASGRQIASGRLSDELPARR